VEKVIEIEVRKNKDDPRRIFVGGFSQGAAVAYNTFLKTKYELGGVFGISGYVRIFNHFLGSTIRSRRHP